MAAVGLSGVFKYGGKFLGYVVAVGLASGVFVGGGAFFAVTGGLALTDPSPGSIATARAFVGVALVAIGGVIALSGLFGLTHKLLADAAATAAAVPAGASHAAVDAEDAPETGEASDEDGSREDGADEPTEPDEEPVSAGEGDSTEPVDDRAPPETPPAAAGSGHPESATANAESAPSSTASSAGSASDDFVDESAADEDWTESKYAKGTQPDDGSHASAATGPNEDGALASNDGENLEGDDQAEWTPPDPAEFEQSTTGGDDGAHDVPTESSGPTEPAKPSESSEPSEPTVTPDDGTDVTGDQADEVRTWDDVRSASAGNGIEAEDSPADVDQPAAVREEPMGADDLVDGGDDSQGPVDQDPVDQDEPSFADGWSSDGSDAVDSTPVGDEDADETEDEDATLADEGIPSFEVEGDDDPLGDRLSGGD